MPDAATKGLRVFVLAATLIYVARLWIGPRQAFGPCAPGGGCYVVDHKGFFVSDRWVTGVLALAVLALVADMLLVMRRRAVLPAG